jgi:choline/glycine/proline betaine transport protein
MLGPTLFTLFWMTVFGNSAIELILNQGVQELAEAVDRDESVALFQFFEYLPMTEVLSLLAVAMVMIFFVTSADSGAMVLNMLCSYGSDATPAPRRIFWMVVIGVTAAVLLLAGGLAALQTAAIASALPFSVALLAAIWGFRSALIVDHAKRQAMVGATLTPTTAAGDGDWETRLANLVHYPRRAEVDQFQRDTVLPALQRFRDELQSNGIEASVQNRLDQDAAVRLEVRHGDELDFVYEVCRQPRPLPGEALTGDTPAVTNVDDLSDAEKYYRAEVHFSEGGQDYDIMGWNEDQVITDVLEQYEKHLHFLHMLR